MNLPKRLELGEGGEIKSAHTQLSYKILQNLVLMFVLSKKACNQSRDTASNQGIFTKTENLKFVSDNP